MFLIELVLHLCFRLWKVYYTRLIAEKKFTLTFWEEGNMSRLKVGVVGVGVGRIHLRGYQALPQEVEVVAVCDLNETRLNQVADEYKVPLRFTDYQQLFQSGEVEAVSICLPNSLHAPV